jgi:hypothetical protein
MGSQPPDSYSAESSRRRWLLAALAIVVVLGIIALAILVAYIFFRPPGPAPVGTDAPLIPEGWLAGPVVLALAALG